MLWETRDNGNFRIVRLTRSLAFKTPRILDRRGLEGEWRRFGNPAERPSIAWLWRTWLKLFRENRLVSEEELQTYQEWKRSGSQKVGGLGLCPILFHLPWGLLNVMPRAAPVPPDRVNKEQDFLSNGAVSFERDECGGRNNGNACRYRQDRHVWVGERRTGDHRLWMATTEQVLTHHAFAAACCHRASPTQNPIHKSIYPLAPSSVRDNPVYHAGSPLAFRCQNLAEVIVSTRYLFQVWESRSASILNLMHFR
jgi:hypothetical protein